MLSATSIYFLGECNRSVAEWRENSKNAISAKWLFRQHFLILNILRKLCWGWGRCN